MGHRTRTLIVSILAIALLAWFLRHSNLGDVWRHIRAADIRLLALAFSLFVVMTVIRAIRWRYLLKPIGPARFSTAMRTTLIGFAVSNVLPARAGEVLRPYLLAREERLNAASAFATIVVERVLDMMAVLALMATYLLASPRGDLSLTMRRAIQTTGAAATLVGLVLLVAMALLASHPERIGNLVRRSERVLPARMAHALAHLARTFTEGLAVARTPGALALATAWTFALWISIALQSWLVTIAFGIEMPFLGGFLLQALLVIGIAVPTPGGVGGFHEAYRLGTTLLFRAPNDAAVGAALVLHAMSFIPTTVIGAIFMVQDGLSVGRLTGLSEPGPTTDLPVVP